MKPNEKNNIVERRKTVKEILDINAPNRRNGNITNYSLSSLKKKNYIITNSQSKITKN